MDDERLNFSDLDPAIDGQRWDALVRATGGRAMARRRSRSFAGQVERWARPAMALAASVALIAWMAVYARGGDPIRGGSAAAQDIVQWADRGAIPTDADLSSLLGSGHEH